MPTIYLQHPLLSEEITKLKKEFSTYEFISGPLDPHQWNAIQILFGKELKEKELHLASRLRWIHLSSTDTERLFFHEIQKKGNIIITMSKGQNVAQIAEFVIGGILTFAKQFFHWKSVVHDPAEFWNWPLKETMWTLKGKVLLQIGLGEVGTQITRQAQALGMKTWGIRKFRSFHPYCKKTFGVDALHSVLPKGDVVCLALPKGGAPNDFFSTTEFNLMKPDSIFVVVGCADGVDEQALAEVAKKGKFRGVILDAFHYPPPSKHSPLWEIPNAILTPGASPNPEGTINFALRQFRKNLRLFALGRISEMKNILEFYSGFNVN
ncbi:MAG: D-2-hydroxyacid dehydrogenase [Chlamydiia bacterium]|nr:D-2-hydroxyacid dehydrogenase [Chlamydiia bacterium]